ncbi:hypothetical protein [Flavobacterium selenitireducens]|uniref:hypothetical protein n=1 Tax=Flavobacterium selenitireducens TaxID=2722704 RepID=UPI00168BDE26|nr:hypothetical protein [Flavobacterium selenitireducens]MBD3583008.1 hypothetical protein [Flavobacterium selenitireducens]
MKQTEKLTIYVDPCCNVLYASFYLYGIRKLYGKNSIKFTSAYFDKFKHNGRIVPIVIARGNELSRVVIDFGDVDYIDTHGIAWCDHYAKVNINSEIECAHPEKLFSIGPSFAIRVFSKLETVLLVLSNFYKGRKRIQRARYFFGEYRAQMNRHDLSAYHNDKPSDDSNVFFASSLWKLEPETNRFRANFINACKKLKGIHFTGGFSPRKHNDVPGFESLTIEKRIDFDEYLELTKSSLTTFSTPAVGKCHGWKIGEFLAMRKAILSTPLMRELPSPLLDGVHIVYTDGSEADIAQKVELLRSDPALRRKIEQNGLAYFNEWLQPEKVVSQIFARAFSKSEAALK